MQRTLRCLTLGSRHLLTPKTNHFRTSRLAFQFCKETKSEAKNEQLFVEEMIERSKHLDSNTPDYFYKLLGVQPSVDQQELRRLFVIASTNSLTLAKNLHPDLVGDKHKELFSKMTDAYKTLSNPDARLDYDDQRLLSEGKVSFGSYNVPTMVLIL